MNNSISLQDIVASFPLQGMADTNVYTPNFVDACYDLNRPRQYAVDFPLLGETMAGTSCQLGSGPTGIDSHSSIMHNLSLARDTGVSCNLQGLIYLHGDHHADNSKHIVQQVADLTPLGVCTAGTSSLLDSGPTGITNNSLTPIYSYSSGMVVLRHASVQEIEQDMMARVLQEKNEDLAQVSRISSNLAHFRSQVPLVIRTFLYRRNQLGKLDSFGRARLETFTIAGWASSLGVPDCGGGGELTTREASSPRVLVS